MTSRIHRLCLSFFVALCAMTSFAQLPTSVDIKLERGGTAGDSLRVYVRSNGTTFQEVVSNIVLTIKYDSVPGVDGPRIANGQANVTSFCPGGIGFITNPTQPFSGIHVYKTYSTFGFAPLIDVCPNRVWPEGTWSLIARIFIQNAGSANCRFFQIADMNDTFAWSNNLSYFTSLNGQDIPGQVTSPPISVGPDADNDGIGNACDTGCSAPVIASTSSNSPICSNEQLQLGVSANGDAPLEYEWIGAGIIVNGNTANATVSGASTGDYSVTVTNGCGSATTNVQVTVNAQPAEPSTGTYGPLCSNDAPIGLGGSPAGGTWSGTGVSGNTFDPSFGTQTLTYTITSGACSNSASTTITVNPQPASPSTGSYGPLCSNDAPIALGGSPAGGTWSGTGVSGNTFDPSFGTQTLTYTITSGGCSNSSSTTIEVNPQPAAPSTGTYDPLCSNDAPIELFGSPAGGTWSGAGISGNMFDPSNGTQTLTYTIASSGCSNSSSTTITVHPQPAAPSPGSYGPLCSNSAPIVLGGSPAGGVWTGTGVTGTDPYTFDPLGGTQTLTYTVTSSGCSNSATTTIIVNAQPAAPTPGSYGPLCSNAASITLGGTPTGGVWTGTGVSGTGPYTFNPAVGTQTLTYTVTSGGCSNSATTTIIVNAQPATPDPGSYGPLCSNASPITLGGSPAGGSWSGTGVSGSGPYTFDPSVGSQTLTYTISNGGCSSSATTTIAIQSAYWNMQTAAPTSSTIANTTISAISRGNNNGTTTLLTNTSASFGYPGSTGNNNAGAAAFIGPLDIDASTYFTFTATPSPGTSFTLNGISFGSRSTGTGPQAYSLRSSLDNYASNIAGGVLLANSTWTLISANGFTVSSGNGQPITFRIYGSGGSGNPGTNTANWRIDDLQLNGCNTPFVCTPPSITSTSSNSPICGNGTLSLEVIATGDLPLNYAWSGAGTITNSNMANASVTGASSGDYLITVTNSCGSTDAAVPVVVNGTPVMTCPDPQQFCINDPAIELTAGSPVGGTYSGSGIDGNIFTPAWAGVGDHLLSYSYTDGNGCTGICNFMFIVNPQPAAPSTGTYGPLCSNDAPIELGGSPAGGTWSGTGVIGNTFDPSFGTQTLTYTITSAGCSNSASTTIEVNPQPAAPSSGTYGPLCSNDAPIELSGSPAGGSWSGTGVIGNTFDPSFGTQTITYTITSAGCSNSASTTISVNPQPAAPSTGTYGPLCSNDAPIELGGSPAGGTWSGTGVSGGFFDPLFGTQTITYTITSAGCSNSASTTIEVNPQPSAPSTGTYGPLCSNDAPIELSGSPAGGTWSGTGVSGSFFDPSFGTQTLTYTITSAGCSNSASTIVIVGNCDCAGIVDGEAEIDACGICAGGTTGIIPNSGCVSLNVKAILDGAYVPFTGLMRDDLRSNSLIPLLQPYSVAPWNHPENASTTTGVLAVAGVNAIVDWVLLELRDGTSPSTIIARKAALIDRSGNVLDVDGSGNVTIPIGSGSYHVAIRHRNHLGVMTASPQPLNGLAELIDLTSNSTATFGTNARRVQGAIMTMWAGNANVNLLVNYSGSANDRTTVLNVLGASTFLTPFAGYHAADLNMNGLVNYSGSNNDRTLILNTLGAGTFLSPISQQLP